MPPLARRRRPKLRRGSQCEDTVVELSETIAELRRVTEAVNRERVELERIQQDIEVGRQKLRDIRAVLRSDSTSSPQGEHRRIKQGSTASGACSECTHVFVYIYIYAFI